MKKIESQNSLVVRANQLIEARYRLTATEQKIIYKLTTMVHREDEDFKPYIMKVADFVELIDTDSHSKYTEVEEVARNLMKKVFTIHDTIRNEKIMVAWFSSVNYKYKKGIIEFEFSPYLKPFMLQLKSCFTEFDLSNVMQLRSGYSLRLYELLKQYETIGKRQLQLDELRELLGLQKEYPTYDGFKRKVLLVAQKELTEKTDILFDFEEIKEVRKVVALRFIIKLNKNKKQKTKSSAPSSTTQSTPPAELSDFDKEYFKRGKIEKTETAKTEIDRIGNILGRIRVTTESE